MDELEARTQQELEAIIAILTELTGLPSRWSGRVELVPNASFKGQKPFRCDVQIDAALAATEERWRTLIHEAFHCLSAGYNGKDFRDYPGWEEGVAEQLQRRFRAEILTELGIAFLPGQFANEDQAHQFNGYTKALVQLSEVLHYDQTGFFIDLLRTPIALRSAFVFGLGKQLTGQRRSDFFYLFSASNSVLKDFAQGANL